MKNNTFLLLCFIAIAGNLAACQETNTTKNAAQNQQQVKPSSEAPANSYSGSVIETMNAGSYTYAQIDTGSEKIWAAGPATDIKIGDKLTIGTYMPMKDFHSKTLARDFDVVYFVNSLGPTGTEFKQKPHGDLNKSIPISTDIEKAPGGVDIGEIYSKKQELLGQTLRVRGVVVKYTADVLGKDWVHLRDNSSSDTLTVTTNDKVKMGDVVIAEGSLIFDKDYGYGYVYDVIMEEAKVTVE